jgi:PAS domain S-box-containing protein
MTFRSRSIRQKLSGIIMITSTVVVLLVCATSVVQDLIDERSELVSQIGGFAQMVATNSAASLTFGDPTAAKETLSLLKTRDSILAGCIYTASGSHFATFKAAAISLPPLPPPDGVFRTSGRVELIRGIFVDGVRIGTVYIISDERQLHARMREDAVLCFIIALVSLVAAFLLSARLQRVISEPIVELAKVAMLVSANSDYSVRVKSETATKTTEIGELVGGFNGMLAEIEKRDATLMDNRAQLESVVAVRTSELSYANEELTAARDAAERIAEINGRLSRSNQLILDAAADGIMGFDVNGVLTFMNPGAEGLLGWSRKEMVGRRLHDFAHRGPDGQPCDIRTCTSSRERRSGVVLLGTDTFWRKDGTSFPVEYSSMPISDEAESEQGFVVTFRDTTERRAIERLKDEFVSTVSHELRTPLTSIRGALGLLSSGMLGPVPEKGLRMLQIAVTNTDRLVRLINDILDLERIDSGKIELTRVAVTAEDLMTEAVDGVSSMAAAADVEIRIGQEAIHTVLSVDRDRILQTLTNLLSNAIKFSPRGTVVSLSAESKGGTFTFAVADHGRGVPPEKRELIFERFKQVDASDSRDKGGSGLGLAICRSIVNAHGGVIWVESAPGDGSVFQFTVPLPIAIAADEASLAARSLLIYSEDGARLTAMVGILESHRSRVYTALSLSALYEAAVENKPNVIVMDFGDGNRQAGPTIQKLKVSADTRDIPIVVANSSAESCGPFASFVTSWVPTLLPSTLREAVAAACSINTPTILIVEDDLDLAKVMTASLERHGIRILHAATGGEAIETARQGEPDLIVMDVVLPDTDGFAVVELLRNDAVLKHLPLIVYSALEVGASDQARLRLGPTEFITKSRGTLADFELQVLRLLKTVTTTRLEALNAA